MPPRHCGGARSTPTGSTREFELNTIAYLVTLRNDYLALHTAKEDLFWQVKMGLADDPSAAADAQAKADLAYNAFLQEPIRINELRAASQDASLSTSDRAEVDGWLRLFQCYTLEDPAAQALSAEILALESELAKKRSVMASGYVDPMTEVFTPASTNKLALLIANDPNEAVRKAALEGLYGVETFVLEHGFLDIVRLRNRLGRMLGYDDYYDWKVFIAEGQRKVDIFKRLAHFLAATEAHTREELQRFQAAHGPDALEPHNFQFLRAGGLSKLLDPYFPFAESFGRWGRSFAALGIKYRGADLTLDLVDRAGKYENGFMHGPGPTYFDDVGAWRSARINFTANAVPGAVGSGLSAATTLFHEGGHAAHFSNVTAGSPCWSNEFAPTSVAYAETQSMFLDSFLGDADWRAKYAKNADGEPVPWSLIERQVREEQPFKGWDVRRLITVPMGERMLYELDEAELTPARVLSELRRIEREVQGLSASARPVLAVPHLLAAESSAYYHAYVLAEMAVQQTRAFFLERDGQLTDNPRIGPDLTSAYWECGNRSTHDETLIALTGSPLMADALIAEANMPVADALAAARVAYDAALAGPAANSAEPNLDATIRIVHGREEVANTADGGFTHAASRFAQWVRGLEESAQQP